MFYFLKGDYENINFNRINRKDKPYCSIVSSNNKVKNISIQYYFETNIKYQYYNPI